MTRQGFFQQVAGLALAACFSFPPTASTAPRSNHPIEWRDRDSATPAVAVTGLNPIEVKLVRSALARESTATKMLSVRVDHPEAGADDVPSIAGTWRQVTNSVIFTPEFPFMKGLTYEARFEVPGTGRPGRSTMTIPKPSLSPQAVVSAIYPSTDELPENLLKFYLHFSQPMSRGGIYQHITLRDEQERLVDLPFLEIGEELWDPEQRRLTLLIDPGRIKRGVKPLEDIGPAIEAGRRYTLHISRKWQDGRGIPLVKDHRKYFRVGPPDRSSPNPTQWRIISPKPGTLDPLEIRFPESLDHALASRVIWIEDSDNRPIRGVVSVKKEETRWFLKPDKPWKPGRHHVRAELILEDLAGNSIGRPFEVDVFNRVDDGIKDIPYGRSFEIRD